MSYFLQDAEGLYRGLIYDLLMNHGGALYDWGAHSSANPQITETPEKLLQSQEASDVSEPFIGKADPLKAEQAESK